MKLDKLKILVVYTDGDGVRPEKTTVVEKMRI